MRREGTDASISGLLRNKQPGSRLLVSDAVVATLEETSAAPTPAAALEVRGYDRPVRVWRLS